MKALLLLAVALAFALVATVTFASPAGEDDDTAMAAEKEMVRDPTTGKMVTAPAYGGTLTYANRLATLFVDPWFVGAPWLWFDIVVEKLGIGNWGIDREEFDLISGFIPVSMIKGSLAASWEVPDNKTYVFHIRKGVRWQDKAPMNGRELTANDIEYNWHRMLGLGSGYDEPMPNVWGELAGVWESITATEKSTLVFRLKEPNLGALRNILIHHGTLIYPPEVIEASKTDEWPEGKIEDPLSVVGTGPYMVADYVEGSSMTYTKNPDYWGYDEKYPENRLPYIDTLTMLIMQENATILAALRSGTIDYAGYNSNSNLQTIDLAESLQKTNPEIALTSWAQRSEVAFSFIVTEPPFNDVNVRHAMQMALDLETINDTYYKGFADTTPSQLIGVKGYMFPFAEWPEELKKSYTYDPDGAEALLDAAGYPRGADGVRFKTRPRISDKGWIGQGSDQDLAELARLHALFDVEMRLGHHS